MDALSECDKALQTFGDILSIDANCQDAQIGHADAQMLKGRCLHSLGNAEEAALHWKRAAQVCAWTRSCYVPFCLSTAVILFKKKNTKRKACMMESKMSCVEPSSAFPPPSPSSVSVVRLIRS